MLFNKENQWNCSCKWVAGLTWLNSGRLNLWESLTGQNRGHLRARDTLTWVSRAKHQRTHPERPGDSRRASWEMGQSRMLKQPAKQGPMISMMWKKQKLSWGTQKIKQSLLQPTKIKVQFKLITTEISL